MTSTFVRTVLSLAVVCGAYWAYVTFAAPHIVGAAGTSTASTATSESATSSSPSVAGRGSLADHLPAPTERFRELIEPLFPVGSWERDEAHVVKNDQFMLLWRRVERREGRQLHVFPCTIVFQPQGLAGGEEGAEHQRTWIVSAPDGAELTFDRMDERLMKLGRLQAANIAGQVTIRGSATRPGAGDEIELTTQNVQLTEQRIWTPQQVHFRMGAHFGSGRDLTVQFSAPTRGDVKRLPATIPARLQSIELVHLDKLQLALPQQPGDVTAGTGAERVSYTPVSISSNGPLLVEMARGVARISDQVRVSRPRLDDTGLSDHLECDQLALFFQRRDWVTAEPAGGSDLLLERVVARGAPAMAFTSHLDQPASQAVYALEAPQLELTLSEAQQFLAEGAGRLRGRFGDDAQRSIELSWAGSASWQENELGPLITVQRQPRVVIDELGSLSADSLRLQLAGRPNSDSQTELLAGLQPRQLWADGQVRLEAEQLQAQIARLSIAFRQQPALSPAEGGLLGPAEPPPPVAGRDAQPSRRFIVTGREMDLVVLQDGQQIQLDDVTIEQGVHCLAVVGNNEGQGAELSGDRLQLQRIASGAAIGSIQGQPVQIRAQGMDVRGGLIRFEQDSNRLWIDGAGSATVPLPAQLANHMPGHLAVGFVGWRDRLVFDGSQLRAEGHVELRGPAQLVRCSTLSAEMSRRVPLVAARGGRLPEMEIASITADGGVLVENRTLDNERLVSIDTGNLRRIRIDNRSGEVQGSGPGWIKTVRYGSVPGPRAPRRQKPADQQRLSFLRVAFQGQLVGNIRSRKMQFQDRIQAVYGPIDSWDEEIAPDPRRLSAEQIALRCDRLSVLQMARRGAANWPLEIQAIGHTLIEGANFTARAHRLAYDQAKDQLVLEGDGQTDARLWREEPGKSRQEMSARKIQYEPSRNRVNIQGANTIELRG